MIGKNLAQEECNWPSKFQGMDFNIIKILSVPFKKICPPRPFLVPASLVLGVFIWIVNRFFSVSISYEVLKTLVAMEIIIFIKFEEGTKHESIACNILDLNINSEEQKHSLLHVIYIVCKPYDPASQAWMIC